MQSRWRRVRRVMWRKFKWSKKGVLGSNGNSSTQRNVTFNKTLAHIKTYSQPTTIVCDTLSCVQKRRTANCDDDDFENGDNLYSNAKTLCRSVANRRCSTMYSNNHFADTTLRSRTCGYIEVSLYCHATKLEGLLVRLYTSSKEERQICAAHKTSLAGSRRARGTRPPTRP